MKNKRRDGAQPEMKSLFRGHGGFPHQAERRGGQPLLCTGTPFMASQRHCLPQLLYDLLWGKNSLSSEIAQFKTSCIIDELVSYIENEWEHLRR